VVAGTSLIKLYKGEVVPGERWELNPDSTVINICTKINYDQPKLKHKVKMKLHRCYDSK
jgi:hypothetical protein